MKLRNRLRNVVNIGSFEPVLNHPKTLINKGMVRVEGLEPPRLAAPEPKRGAYCLFSIAWLPDFAGQNGNKQGKRETAFSHSMEG
jgi:hypothetical protein